MALGPGERAPEDGEAVRRVLREHGARVPVPEMAEALLHRWAEGPGLPFPPQEMLHLLYLSGTSEALTLSLLRRPHLLGPLSRDVSSSAVLGEKGMEEVLGRFLLRARGDSPEGRLAAFRMYQSARILLLEVLGSLPLERVTSELSALADTLIRRAFQEVYQPLRERLGLPMRSGADGRPTPCSLAVIALGKLGGAEVNYASDVDLAFFYEEEGTTDRGVENGRFFSTWVRDACGLLTRPTPDGPALKVDSNLRPRGRDGELTLSFAAALAYYREWADLWERQAWTRARPCAGDLAAGGRFLRDLEETLFRPYAFPGIAFQNREARSKAVARLRARSGAKAELDLKDGPGGIRDIEFAVQALQMAHGQADRWVREPNTPMALGRLAQKSYLDEAERAALGRAYALLRRAEHWAQVQGMRQEHGLPQEEVGWPGLARYLGIAGTEAARRELAGARGDASRIFSLVCSRLERSSAGEDEVETLLDPQGVMAALVSAGVPDAQRASPTLAEIYRALEPHITTPERRNHFLRIHHSLARELASGAGTQAGLAALHRLLPALREEKGLLTLALDKPRLTRLVYWLAGRSDVLLERMQQWPHLLRRLTFRDLRSLPRYLDAIAAPADPDGIRRRQKEALFLVGSRALFFAEGTPFSHEHFTEIAERVLRRVFEEICAQIGPAYGMTPGELEGTVSLLALGRLGTREMLPRSDLDLVMVKRGAWVLPEHPDRSATLETALVRRLADALTAVTRHGALYPVDFRLRPHGAGGSLAVSAESLGGYFGGPADAWERVAWLKARGVAGDSHLARESLDAVRGAVFGRGLSEADLDRLDSLRERLASGDPSLEGTLKFGAGGLMASDFLLLSAEVRAGVDAAPSPRTDLLRTLSSRGIFSREEGAALGASMEFQEALILRLRLKYLRPPEGRRTGEVLSTLAREGFPGGASGEVGQGREGGAALREVWEGHRQTVESAWRKAGGTPPS